VIVLRRALPKGEAAQRAEDGQPTLPGLVIEHKDGDWYEHAVLVTNWAQEELRAIAQIYRDRGDAEDMLDELINEWGWTGFSKAGLKRNQLMARWRTGAATATRSRRARYFSMGLARRTRHANQTVLPLSSQHGKERKLVKVLNRMSGGVQRSRDDAEQLAKPARWARLVWRIFADLVRFPLDTSGILALNSASHCRIWDYGPM
jgi:hypothetical protein